jgi:hypothetical protein
MWIERIGGAMHHGNAILMTIAILFLSLALLAKMDREPK